MYTRPLLLVKRVNAWVREVAEGFSPAEAGAHLCVTRVIGTEVMNVKGRLYVAVRDVLEEKHGRRRSIVPADAFVTLVSCTRFLQTPLAVQAWRPSS